MNDFTIDESDVVRPMLIHDITTLLPGGVLDTQFAGRAIRGSFDRVVFEKLDADAAANANAHRNAYALLRRGGVLSVRTGSGIYRLDGDQPVQTHNAEQLKRMIAQAAQAAGFGVPDPNQVAFTQTHISLETEFFKL